MDGNRRQKEDDNMNWQKRKLNEGHKELCNVGELEELAEWLKAERPKNVPGHNCSTFFPQKTLSTVKRGYVTWAVSQQKRGAQCGSNKTSGQSRASGGAHQRCESARHFFRMQLQESKIPGSGETLGKLGNTSSVALIENLPWAFI